MSEHEPMTWEEANALQAVAAESPLRLGAPADDWMARYLRLDALARQEKARAEKAEQERNEAISEEAHYWEKRTVIAEVRLAAAEELAKAAMKFCLNRIG